MKFYLEEVEHLPSETHIKTRMGSLAHDVLACLKNPRHRKHYNAIIGPPLSYKNSPAVARLVRALQYKHVVPIELLEDLDGMLYVALCLTDFLHSKALRVFAPEHEFNIQIGNAVLRGFIDDLAEYDWGYLITDYKTQAQRFSAYDLANNIQATIYQRYVWHAFQKSARVDFIMLRHPPTKRLPQKHIQSVEPKTPEQLLGLDNYLSFCYPRLNNFTYQDAFSHFCENPGFCDNVCGMRRPFQYQSVIRDGQVVKNCLLTNKVCLKAGEQIVIKQFGGCAKFN